MSRASMALSNAMFLEIVNGLHSLNQTLIEKDGVITRLRADVQSLQMLVSETRFKAERLEGRNTVLETENSQLKAELENNKQKMRSAIELLIDGNDSVGRKVKDKLVLHSQAAKETARKTTNVAPLPRAAVHPIPAATAKATAPPHTIFTLKRKMEQGGSAPSRLPILTLKKPSDTKPKDPNIISDNSD
ncbi:unnamed protein product [Orchesella dallaii]|uniref:Uncharacterized protein n=1 Tax=Orchesella dallaii TaxID=48710 RepID=A0ABP1RGY4_9HEXA